MKRSRLRPISDKRRAQLAETQEVRAAVYDRLGCEAQIDGVCQGFGSNVHHVLRRSQGGTDHPSNLLLVCGSGTTGCHGWIHANPSEAKERGLLASPTPESGHRHRRSSATPVDAGVVAGAVGVAHTDATVPARLPVLYVKDPVEWARLEGFEVWGWIRSQ